MSSGPSVWARGLTWLAAVLGVLGVGIQVLPAADTWWHIAAGEKILENGGLLYRDPFSFTAGDHPWLNHEWLVEILFAQTVKWWGLSGLCLLKLALLIVSGAVLPCLSHHRNGERHDWLWLIPLLALACEWAFFVDARAYLITYLLLSFTVFALLEHQRSHDWRWLAPLPLAQLLWVNSHGGFILGPAVMGVFFLCGPKRRTLGAFTALTLFCAVFNPEGKAMLLFPFSLLQTDAFSVGLNEWARPDLLGKQLPYSLVVCFTVAVVLWRRQHINLALVLSTCAFLLLGLKAWRHEPLAALMLFYLLPATLPRLRLTATKTLAVATAFFVASLAFVFTKRHIATGAQMLGLNFFPLEATQYLTQTPNLPRHLFNPYGWGGFLLWRLPPHYKIFFDGRAHTVYPETVFRDGYYIQYGEPWLRILSKRGLTLPNRSRSELLTDYGIDLVLSNRFQGDLAQYLAGDPEWTPIYQDFTSVLFLRRP